MAWVPFMNGEQISYYDPETGQMSNTDPMAAVHQAMQSVVPPGWSRAGDGSEGTPNGWYWNAPNGRQFYIPGSLGVARNFYDIFGTDSARPDDALGVMIQAGYDEPTIRAMMASNPVAFKNVGITADQLPYWLQQARQQQTIGEQINANDKDTLGNLVRNAIISAGVLGPLGFGPTAAGGAIDQLAGSLTGNAVGGVAAAGAGAGAQQLASNLIGADPIETMIRVADVTGANTWTQAAQQLGFNTVESLLQSVNPAWVQTGLQYALNNPLQAGKDLIKTGSLTGMETGADGSQVSKAATEAAAETGTGGDGTTGTDPGPGADPGPGPGPGGGGTGTGPGGTGPVGDSTNWGDLLKTAMSGIAGLTSLVAGLQNKTSTYDPAADMRALENERIQRSANARGAVSGAFSGFGDDYYKGIEQAYKDYQMPMFTEQAAAARRALPASVATTRSSAYQRRAGQLETDIQRAQADIGRNAVEAANQRRGEVDNARQSLFALADETGDASTAAAESAARARSLSSPVSFSPIGDLFGKYMNDASAAAILRGQQEGQSAVQTRPLLFSGGSRRSAVRTVS